MTHTHDNPNPTSDWADDLDPEVRDEVRSMVGSMLEPWDPQASHGRRLFLLGRVEQVLRTADLQSPDDFFENIQTRPLDMLAHFFGQFHPDDFRPLTHGDCDLVEDWLFFRCGLSSDGQPQLTIPQRVADLTREGRTA